MGLNLIGKIAKVIKIFYGATERMKTMKYDQNYKDSLSKLRCIMEARMRGHMYFTDEINKQTSAHISLCSPVKHNISFSCFLLADRTTVDCCGFMRNRSIKLN